jgi:hypothetical protein
MFNFLLAQVRVLLEVGRKLVVIALHLDAPAAGKMNCFCRKRASGLRAFIACFAINLDKNGFS